MLITWAINHVFWTLQQWKFSNAIKNLPKYVEIFAKYKVNPQKIAKDINCCHNGKISRNLVTLQLVIKRTDFEHFKWLYHYSQHCFLKSNYRPLFRLFSSFQTNIKFLQQIYVKMSIQYALLGYEPTSFGTWVSCYNHLTRAPAFQQCYNPHK